MNTGVQRGDWAATRWVVVFAGIATLLVASIVSLTRWPTLPEPVLTERPSFVLDVPADSGTSSPQLDWVGDPTQFATGDPRGFSGSALRQLPRTEYRLTEWQESPKWLKLDSELRRLGRIPPQAPAAHPPHELPVPLLPVTIQPTPLLGADTKVSASQPLPGRALLNIDPVTPPAGELFPAAVVEVAVNSWGQVVTARLLASTGSAPLDAAVLKASRGARFEARKGRITNPDAALTDLERGRLTFTWGSGNSLR